MQYADVIIDISAPTLDKTFQYAIPAELAATAVPGAPVEVPFGKGNTLRKGYIVGISDKLKFAPEKIKEIHSVTAQGLTIEDELAALAYWMKEQYGGTLNDALRAVIPVKQTVRQTPERFLVRCEDPAVWAAVREQAKRRGHRAKLRLLEQMEEVPEIPYSLAVGKLQISAATLKSLTQAGAIAITEKKRETVMGQGIAVTLNKEQEAACDAIEAGLRQGTPVTYLLHGVTGSGKTEVYLRVIQSVLAQGKQVIVLIPEIALTYQTVLRFYRCFGDRAAYLHSKLSKGERYLQSERAKRGEISIMIGPRSALFTPFRNLGLIIIDEEQEGSYKSETTPKYHARETAIRRAEQAGASVLLGSATPSLEAYTRALRGEYTLLRLTERAAGAKPPRAEIVDMREELRAKNRSIFSRSLQQKIKERLEAGEQIMLFLNRRGYSGAVSCRSCGEAIQCPHCDISLTEHKNGTMVCHYCGYTVRKAERCPACKSPYLGAFGIGTQKIEEMTKAMFPTASVLRMDADTTQKKDGYEEILSAFREGAADILIGTQMIVKGHDFPRVTLVGILAADLSLHAADYRAAERTFQLLAQAGGRAGRGEMPGEVVIQTYQPEHYAVRAAADEDYAAFYRQEMQYRTFLRYPPAGHLLVVLAGAETEEYADGLIDKLAQTLHAWEDRRQSGCGIIGPAPASLRKTHDIFRKVLYIKHEKYEILTAVKNELESAAAALTKAHGGTVQFDFDPMAGY